MTEPEGRRPRAVWHLLGKEALMDHVPCEGLAPYLNKRGLLFQGLREVGGNWNLKALNGPVALAVK